MKVLTYKHSIEQVEFGEVTIRVLEDVNDSSVLTVQTVLDKNKHIFSEEFEKMVGKKRVIPFNLILKLFALVVYNFYFGFAIFYHMNHKLPNCVEGNEPEGCWKWCNGIGVVVIITITVYSYMIFKAFSKIFMENILVKKIVAANKELAKNLQHKLESSFASRITIQLVLSAAVVAFFLWDTWGDQE